MYEGQCQCAKSRVSLWIDFLLDSFVGVSTSLDDSVLAIFKSSSKTNLVHEKIVFPEFSSIKFPASLLCNFNFPMGFYINNYYFSSKIPSQKIPWIIPNLKMFPDPGISIISGNLHSNDPVGDIES